MGRGAMRRSTVFRASLAVLAVAGTGAVHARIDTTASIGQSEHFVPRPDRARISSLGFDAVVADYYWLLAVQLVGGNSDVVRDFHREDSPGQPQQLHVGNAHLFRDGDGVCYG